MDPVDLVDLGLAWEERLQSQDLEHDTADTPDIHLLK